MTDHDLLVVNAGLNRPSSTRLLADRLATATSRALEEAEIEPAVHNVDLRDLAHDITNNLLTGFPAGELATVHERLAAADGLIAVTPVFSASYSGLFKSFFDLVDPSSLAGKPVLVAATGGTARHSLALDHALRPLFAYFRAVVVPTGVYAATEDWGSSGTGADALGERIARAAGELAALMAARPETVAPTDSYADPTPFSQLLADLERIDD